VATARRTKPRRRLVDPFVSDLIARLQAEVRRERASRSGRITTFSPISRCGLARPILRADHSEQAEAEITWRESPLQFTEPDFDAWERGSIPPGSRRI
jgi:hypothetical protein